MQELVADDDGDDDGDEHEDDGDDDDDDALMSETCLTCLTCVSPQLMGMGCGAITNQPRLVLGRACFFKLYFCLNT